MSKLDELIDELCPDGVEYRELKHVLTIKNGKDYKSLSKGKYPVYGSGGIMTYVSGYVYDKPSVLIPRKGSIDKLYYVEEPFWNVDTIFYTDIDTTKVVPRYVYFCLQREHLEQYNTAGGVPSLTQKVLNKVKLPVPPLEVQREIVRILDSFTLLTAELTAELTARKKQYEYYRNKLLTFRFNEAKSIRLGDACIMKAGKAINTISISEEKTENYKYECYGGNGIRGYVESPSHQGEYPIIGRQGALCGNVNYAQGEFYATEHAVVVDGTGNVLQRYLYHMLTAMNLNQYKSQGAQPGLAVSKLENLQIKLPSIERQKKIVKVLDNFDAICTDLNIGLPAEIKARQKQYEYYRDKLLSFKEI
ncbi:restriction endonuclease subunit S [Lachnospiraceae bacterium 42-17]|jgi:type I restriction enzyme S subunit